MSLPMSMSDEPGRAGRSRWSWWPALLVTLGLLACTPTEPDDSTPPGEPKVTEPSGSSLYLELASWVGDTVAEALVSLSSGQPRQADTRGTLLLEKLPVGRQVMRVEARDHYPSLLAFDMAEGVRAGARLKLLPLGTPVATFDAGQETTISKGGVTLTVPAGALLDARGNPIQGQVDAYMTALDLESGELVSAPGMLEGIPAPGAEPVGLESLGMVALAFQQEARLVPFARGIRIRGSVPSSIRVGAMGGPGTSPVLTRFDTLSGCPLPRPPGWRLDPDTGRWVPTGALGQLVESGTGGPYDWELTLDNPPTLLNVALPYWWCSPSASASNPLQVPTPAYVETACLSVRVEDTGGQPVAGRMVVARGVGYTGTSRALTNASGQALLEVKRNQSVDVDAGAGATRVSTGTVAGDCRGHGASPTPVTLPVPTLTCTPGAARDCGPHGGPAGTDGTGICRAPRQSCDAQGASWSATCAGEVLPQEERCDNTLDDDCDGATNETCATICQPGATRSCYDGPAGTENVGQCRAGIQLCNGSGTDWTSCEGKYTPVPEECFTAIDDDCDGQLNEASSCVWGATGDMASPRVLHAATLLDNGKVLVSGGQSGNPYEQTAELYHPLTRTWSSAGSMAVPRGRHGLTPLPNGKVLASGGSTTSDPYVNTTELYDPATNTWSSATSMAEPRARHGATLLNNGKVLVSGSFDGSTSLSTAELYDPVANSWSPAGSMASSRGDHTATLLNNGKVLVVGGFENNTPLQTAELYDPVANSWSPAGSMASSRANHTATLLNDGKVLVVGGYNGSRLQTAELYDPVANSWSSVQAMTHSRVTHTATLLDNGKVLVSGGHLDGGPAQAAELYDPATDIWSFAGPMLAPRELHTATRLPGGQVLVVGGHPYAPPELYTP